MLLSPMIGGGAEPNEDEAKLESLEPPRLPRPPNPPLLLPRPPNAEGVELVAAKDESGFPSAPPKALEVLAGAVVGGGLPKLLLGFDPDKDPKGLAAEDPLSAPKGEAEEPDSFPKPDV